VPRLQPEQLAELTELVETGPDHTVHGMVGWRRIDLQRVISECFGVVCHERTVGKLLKALGFSNISARPRHPGQDEARIGRKDGLVRQWARRGTRPRQPADQRYQSACLFGAICPARGTGAALALPYADTQAMQLHLDEIGRTVTKGAHAVFARKPALEPRLRDL